MREKKKQAYSYIGGMEYIYIFTHFRTAFYHLTTFSQHTLCRVMTYDHLTAFPEQMLLGCIKRSQDKRTLIGINLLTYKTVKGLNPKVISKVG